MWTFRGVMGVLGSPNTGVDVYRSTERIMARLHGEVVMSHQPYLSGKAEGRGAHTT